MPGIRYWLWLAAKSEVRPKTKTVLLKHYGDPRAIFLAPRGEFEKLGLASGRDCALLEDRSLEDADRIGEKCAADGITVLTMQDAAYPRRLASIFDPPAVIFVRGCLPDMDSEAAVAIVGTRRATPYGLRTAKRLGREIVRCGGLVVSGLTKGVDAAAAEGALLAGGTCVGVFGGAIDSAWGGELALDVCRRGALVGEYPPGAAGHASYFRARNRITAGLSVAAVVVEAPEKSGALLFADEALSQGREVFAVPANVDSPASRGSNALLKDGAPPAEWGWDILEGYAERFPDRLRDMWGRDEAMRVAEDETPYKTAAEGGKNTSHGETREKKVVDKAVDVAYIDLQGQLEGLSERQLGIIAAIKTPGMHVDDIIEATGFAPAAVTAELTMLQIQGFVIQEPGKRFTLNIRQK